MEDNGIVTHRGRISEITTLSQIFSKYAEKRQRHSSRYKHHIVSTKQDESELDSRTRLLRSQLRRQKALERLKIDRRMARKEEQTKREDGFPPDEEPFNFLPPLNVSSGVPQQSTQNTKSALVDVMMMQSAQLTQMMSQRMMLSLVTPNDREQSHRSRTRQRDKLLLSLIIEAAKDNHAAIDSARHVHRPPYYLPALPRLPAPASEKTRHETKPVLEETGSPEHLMTSRWKARAPAKLETTLGNALSSGTNRNIQQRSRVLKKFRLAAYCAVFASIMRRKDAKRLMYVLKKPAIDDYVITGIRIKECVQAFHRVYLNPERRMLRILRQIYDSNLDLSSVLTDSSTKDQRHRATETLASFIEHIAYEMTFVPTATGNLGTENRSNLYHILQPQQSFPEHYFWPVEEELLAIDSHNRTTETIGPNEAFILLIGLSLGRAFVATILRHPYQFGLTTQSVKTEALLTKVRLIVTLFIYLIRKLYAPPNGSPVAVAFPDDFSKKLYTDETMSKLFKKLQTSFDYAEKLLREWGENYVRKLRHA